MRHLIDITDLSVEEINSLIKTAKKIINDKNRYSQVCRGKKLATLFFEPSTRTRLSFEAAMIELGGNVLGFSSADCSSTAKGETVTDTIRTVGCYADIIAMRHPKEGAPKAASAYSPVPVINAGDGGHNHPTQTLADLLTICREKRRLNNFTIGFCGDLMFGRTVHSLIAALSRYDNINYVLISPEELRIPSYIKDGILKGSNCRESEFIEDVISELDILYMTRVQKERFFNEADYIRLKDSYILEPKKLKNAKDDMIIMHPLPRVNEIPHSIDRDKRACYFKQVLNGKYIRMALILKLLETEVLYED